MGIGLRLKTILRDQKMTIKQLSEKSGISINTLYSITKRDSESIDPVILKRIADALAIPDWQLLGGIKNETGKIQIPITIDADTAAKIGVDKLKPGEHLSTIIDPQSPEGVALLNSLGIKSSDPIKLNQGSYLSRTELPLISSFRKLNDDGKKKAIERVEELSEIQKYQVRKEKFSDAFGDVMTDTPDIRDDFITWMMAFPDEALPVIAKYLQDVAKDPEAYLKCSEAERQKKTAKFTEDVATAIKEAEQKNP